MKKHLKPGIDYYLEGGKVVFTAKYHLDRGHCCGNRCRHCPYEPAHKKVNHTKKKDFSESEE